MAHDKDEKLCKSPRMPLNALANYLRSKSLSSFLVVIIALVMAMQIFALPTRSLVRLEAGNTLTTLSFLPDMKTRPVSGAKDYNYKFSVYYSDITWQQTSYSITPAGCINSININNKPVTLAKSPGCNSFPGSYWNVYERPFFIDLAPYLHNGRNTVEVRTSKPEFDMGPIILNDNAKPAKWIGLAMVFVTCIYLVLLMQRHTGDWIGGLILSGGFLSYMNRFVLQSGSQYSMDLPGHLDYITYIAQNWSIPKPYWGYSFYHAPLYYMLEAINIYLVNLLRSFDALAYIQLFSLACFMVFIVFSALALHKLIRNKFAYYLAVLLLVFYPSGILIAARIDSNLLFYACYSACLYFTLGWLRNNQPKYLVLTLIAFGLAMASRANALVLLPILGIVFAYKVFRRKLSKELLENPYIRIGLLIACLGIAMGPGRTEYYRLVESRSEPFLVSNVHVLPRVIRLEPWSYDKLLMPNLAVYLKHPLWSVFTDENGRQYFWNSMLKSSLFGEYDWGAKGSAGIIGVLLLLVILYIIDGAIVHRRVLRAQPEWWICVITLFIPIAALMENRVLNPFASSEDFRYIYPALASFCGLFGLVIEQHVNDWRPFRKALGMVLCVAFCVCAVKFYLV